MKTLLITLALILSTSAFADDRYRYRDDYPAATRYSSEYRDVYDLSKPRGSKSSQEFDREMQRMEDARRNYRDMEFYNYIYSPSRIGR